MVLQDPKDSLVLQVLLEKSSLYQDRKAPLVQLAQPDLKETLAVQDHLELPVKLALKEKMVLMEQLDLRDLKANEVMMDPPELLAYLELKEREEKRDVTAYQVLSELQVLQEKTVDQGKPDHKDQRVILALPVRLLLPRSLAHQVLQELLVKMELQAPPV